MKPTLKTLTLGATALVIGLSVAAKSNLANATSLLHEGTPKLEITDAHFQPNMPHHIGKCPETKTIRVFFSGKGSGDVKIRITDDGVTINESGNIAFDASKGQHHYDFEMEAPEVANFELNKTFTHNLKLHMKSRDKDELEKSLSLQNYQLEDQVEWKRRCTPQVSIGRGGNGLNQNNKATNSDNTPRPAINKIQAQPQKGVDPYIRIEPIDSDK
ncbi:MAG: hypothetical protein AAF569_05220 [Pseudomonadota bacterium]